MEHDGDQYEIYPEVWTVFADWWGDKAYRQLDFLETLQAVVIETYLENRG